MVTGCNWMLMVIHDFYFQLAGDILVDFSMDTLVAFTIPLVDTCLNLS
jgi:hypothetical protein